MATEDCEYCIAGEGREALPESIMCWVPGTLVVMIINIALLVFTYFLISTAQAIGLSFLAPQGCSRVLWLGHRRDGCSTLLLRLSPHMTPAMIIIDAFQRRGDGTDCYMQHFKACLPCMRCIGFFPRLLGFSATESPKRVSDPKQLLNDILFFPTG